MTIDQGPDTARYQGIVALEGKDLEHARTSISCARNRSRPACAWRWPRNCGRRRTAPVTAGAPAACCCSSCRSHRNARVSPISIRATCRRGWSSTPQPEDDAWVEGRSLVATVEDLELLDPDVSAEQLLYRLFTSRACACSAARTARGVLVLAHGRGAHASQLSPG
jgi:Disulfide bond chaperones of the HSP33 family